MASERRERQWRCVRVSPAVRGSATRLLPWEAQGHRASCRVAPATWVHVPPSIWCGLPGASPTGREWAGWGPPGLLSGSMSASGGGPWQARQSGQAMPCCQPCVGNVCEHRPQQRVARLGQSAPPQGPAVGEEGVGGLCWPPIHQPQRAPHPVKEGSRHRSRVGCRSAVPCGVRQLMQACPGFVPGPVHSGGPWGQLWGEELGSCSGHNEEPGSFDRGGT